MDSAGALQQICSRGGQDQVIFQRVKPNTRKLAKAALTSKTPNVPFRLLDTKGGVAHDGAPTDFPRSTEQLRQVKYISKIPGKSVTAAGLQLKGTLKSC